MLGNKPPLCGDIDGRDYFELVGFHVAGHMSHGDLSEAYDDTAHATYLPVRFFVDRTWQNINCQADRTKPTRFAAEGSSPPPSPHCDRVDFESCARLLQSAT